jgi:uncharacterized LabA/DUF88 family protein
MFAPLSYHANALYKMKDNKNIAYVYLSNRDYIYLKNAIPEHLYSLIRNSLTHSEIAMTEEQLSLVIHLLKQNELRDIAEVMQLSGRLKFDW